MNSLQTPPLLKKTPLYDHHVALKAKMIDFNGWSMPVFYSGIIAEHQWVRNACGLFDVSHLGQMIVKGDKARQFLQTRITNDMNKLSDGRILYTLLCDEAGFILDDLLIYQIRSNEYCVVVNAANQETDCKAFEKYAPAEVELANESDHRGCLAVQGPKAETVLNEILKVDLRSMAYYQFCQLSLNGELAIVSRSGYTGEDGFEVFAANKAIVNLWEDLMRFYSENTLRPIGLGARNTLRLEAGNALYGSDIDDKTTPLEAGLGWAISWEKGAFVGRDVLLRQKKSGTLRKLVGFKMLGRQIAREHYPVFKEGKKIGLVTSGSFGPSLGCNIGMAYVDTEHSSVGNRAHVSVHGTLAEAEIVKRPFIVLRHKK